MVVVVVHRHLTILSGMKTQLVSDRRARNGEVGAHRVMVDGDDEVAKVMNYAGGARRGPVSDLLHVGPDNVGERRTPADHVIPPERRPHKDRTRRHIEAK